MDKRKKKSCKQRSSSKRNKVENYNFLGNFTLPGFHYLGPGGEKANGLPTNAIDAIAKKHDEAYDQAVEDFKKSHDIKQSVEEIKKADEKFLVEIEATKATTPLEVLGKAVGIAGIGIKAAVENSLGYTLYPAFDKMTDSSAGCSTITKVRAGDDFN